ncbi:MAG: hypothetical protein JXR91_07680 [Deltaproteobacteria bacterium]|nr:hypothetical protein [Deltaproteobacteria bacterium]
MNLKNYWLYFLFSALVFTAACSDSGGGSGDTEDSESDTSEDTDMEKICSKTPGLPGCPCQFSSECNDGLVCDDEDLICREPVDCLEVDCGTSGICQPFFGSDAICLKTCQPGFEPDSEFTQCVPVTGLSCVRGSSNSIYEECKELLRGCVESNETAQCGDCFFGYVLDNGVCVPQEDCVEAGCSDSNMTCIPAGEGHSAVCDECSPGFVEVDGVCKSDLAASCTGTGNIKDDCDELYRYCNSGTADSGATCGKCIDGYFENFATGACELETDCETLKCKGSNQICEYLPNATCTDCVEGFVKNIISGICEKALTCDELNCTDGADCEPATKTSDAFCFDNHGCGNDKLWSSKLESCVQCPVCGDDEGEESYRWPELTEGSDRCICTTKDGYFFSDSSDLQVYPCDNDGDGWVRSDARSAIEKPEGSPLKENARCHFRSINRFILENEQGKITEEKLDFPAYLYEPTRLDDDYHIMANPDDFPAYNANSRQFYARELNPLTKACVSRKGDFNNNGISDVTEWQQQLSGTGEWKDVKDFLPFTFFLELNNSWYEDTDKGGAYHIQEKSRFREAFPEDHVPVSYPVDKDGDYWQECTVLADSWFDSSSSVQDLGMDFARNIDAKMNLHSQFKCSIFATVEPKDRETEAQTTITKQEIEEGYYFINSCYVDPVSIESLSDDTNPWSPQINCFTVDDVENMENGDVAWAAVGYFDYNDGYKDPTDPEQPSYVRGCVNECAYAPELCPGYNSACSSDDPDILECNPSRNMCDGQTGNYGKINCGCGLSYANSDQGLGVCGTGCIYHAVADTDMTPLDRAGAWNCGGVSTYYDKMAATDSDGKKVTLKGRVSGLNTGVTATGENSDGDKYSLKKGTFRMTGKAIIK